MFILAPRFSYRKQSTGRVVDFVVGLEIYNNQELALQPNIIKELFEILGERIKKLFQRMLNEIKNIISKS